MKGQQEQEAGVDPGPWAGTAQVDGRVRDERGGAANVETTPRAVWWSCLVRGANVRGME